jgi:competence protein ComEA
MKKLVISVLPLLLLPIALAAEDLPQGKGRDITDEVCNSCHSADLIFDFRSDTTDKAAWRGKVDDMVARGAELKKEEIETIVDYLTKYLGPSVNINKAAAADLQKEFDLSAQEAQAIVQYRQDKGNFKEFADLTKVSGLDAKKIEPFKKRIAF